MKGKRFWYSFLIGGIESHKENWKYIYVFYVLYSVFYSNLIKRIERNQLLLTFSTCIQESHKENWKVYHLSNQNSKNLSESHKENWKVSVVFSSFAKFSRNLIKRIESSSSSSFGRYSFIESHKENWKTNVLFYLVG